MKPRDDALAPTPLAQSSTDPVQPNGSWRRFAWMAGSLTICFAIPLYGLVRFALGSDLYSHVVLIPFISGYLIWLRRKSLPARTGSDPQLGAIFAFFGAAVLAGYGLTLVLDLKLPRADRLAWTLSSYLLLVMAAGAWVFGREMLRAVAFPLLFLVFMLPMPVFMTNGIETFLQHGSADVAYALLQLAGTPVFREGLVLQLPGIVLQVAPECSGIHSTLALFITSLLAGYFFLRSPVRRALLALCVVPLALARNGVRIFTISELCVQISPDMIHSYIHRHGGPLFFALSLIPFFALLLVLRRSERRSGPKPTAAS